MSQQINLLSPAFRRQRLMLSATNAAGCVAAMLFVMFALQFYFQQQIKGLNADLQSTQGVLKTRQSQIEKLKADSAKLKKNEALEGEIARLEVELKFGRESIQALKSGALGNQQGFSEYMRAFSRQAISGLWLTGFVIAGAGNISIQGRVTQPDLVPSYLQRLNSEKVLQGRSFASLEIRQPKSEPAGRGDSKDQKKIPGYLEFSLTTAESAGVVANAGKAK